MFTVKGIAKHLTNSTSNGGNSKFLMTVEMKVKDIIDRFEINSDVNRDIVPTRISEITRYINTYDKKIGIYFPSIIVAATEDPVDIEEMQIKFNESIRFIILDGQHRMKALEAYKNKEQNPERLSDILNSTLTVQIYFNLSKHEQRKLFLDINSKSKKVSNSLAFQFDTRDPLNTMIKDLLSTERKNRLSLLKIDQKSRIVRPHNKSWMSISRFNRFLSYFLFNTVKTSNKTALMLSNNYIETLTFVERYLENLLDVFPEDFGNVQKQLLGHEALQNALAIASHENFISWENGQLKVADHWEDMIEILGELDFSVDSLDYQNLLAPGKNYKQFKDNKHSEILPILRRQWQEKIQDAEEEY